MKDEIKEILQSENIHIIESNGKWNDIYGYEKSQLKNDLIDYIIDLQEENERLNNIINEFENKGYDIAQERADFLLEIDRLNNIIKEVREYVRSNEWTKDYEISSCRTHLLEILDKENKDE